LAQVWGTIFLKVSAPITISYDRQEAPPKQFSGTSSIPSGPESIPRLKVKFQEVQEDWADNIKENRMTEIPLFTDAVETQAAAKPVMDHLTARA